MAGHGPQPCTPHGPQEHVRPDEGGRSTWLMTTPPPERCKPKGTAQGYGATSTWARGQAGRLRVHDGVPVQPTAGRRGWWRAPRPLLHRRRPSMPCLIGFCGARHPRRTARQLGRGDRRLGTAQGAEPVRPPARRKGIGRRQADHSACCRPPPTWPAATPTTRPAARTSFKPRDPHQHWADLRRLLLLGDPAAYCWIEPPGAGLAASPLATTASADYGNPPQNTLDNDFNSRWSAQGDGQWIQFDLGGRGRPVRKIAIGGTREICAPRASRFKPRATVRPGPPDSTA